MRAERDRRDGERQVPLPVPDHYRPTATEACVAMPSDRFDPAAPLFGAPIERAPREVLELILREQLQRSPCLVAFSGGKDSSTLLAVVTHVARRDGLPLPVPITNRFPAIAETEESEWQEQVITSLDLDDWIRLDWGDELDLLGEFGRRVLRRHGLIFPTNAHFLEPMLEQAAGGALITGIGGDELLGPHPRAIASALVHRRRLPRRSTLKAFALEVAPRAVRVEAQARRAPIRRFRWIRSEVRLAVAREYVLGWESVPLRWDRSLARLWRGRYLQCLRVTLEVLGRAHEATAAAPFLDPRLLRAYAHAWGAGGPGGAVTGHGALAGGLLPATVLRRRTKASFDEAFWNRSTRAFAERWDGRGLDPNLVDIDALREEWQSPLPTPQSSMLLQQAWLADSRRGA